MFMETFGTPLRLLLYQTYLSD